jgi:hypothetical protein
MERDTDGKYICPHNQECRCDIPECHKCGWNPEVAERRRKEFKSKLYKVPFTGYCEVYANSAEEAAQKADDIQQQFFAHYDYDDPICLSKEEDNELD